MHLLKVWWRRQVVCLERQLMTQWDLYMYCPYLYTEQHVDCVFRKKGNVQLCRWVFIYNYVWNICSPYVSSTEMDKEIVLNNTKTLVPIFCLLMQQVNTQVWELPIDVYYVHKQKLHLFKLNSIYKKMCWICSTF